MSTAQMTVLAVVVGIAIFLGVAVNIVLVIFSEMCTRDMVRLDSQVRQLTSIVAALNQSLQETSSSSKLHLEILNLTLEEKSSSTERRLEILTGFMDVKFDSLNSSFMTVLDAMSSNQTALVSRQEELERFNFPLKSCQEYTDIGVNMSGVYTLYLGDGRDPFPVFCDMESDGLGWAVFQRRIDGSEDFYRTWADYEAGFGHLEAEFWLGNDKLHRLTSAGLTRLRVDLGDWQNNTAYAVYSVFSVAGEEDNYKLNVSGYSGTAGDSLSYNNGRQFSTKDKDNDGNPIHCAVDDFGAWWYKYCTLANLNGLYNTTEQSEKAVHWYHWKSLKLPLQWTEMKIR